MNFLILVNSAPQYKYYYFRIGCALKSLGHQVYYAVDAKRSAVLEPLPELDAGVDTFYFDEYFKKNYESLSVTMSEETTWGEYFFSEFDRFLTHDFNLNRPKEYWERAKCCLDGFFNELINKHNIDAVVYENISNSFAFAAYSAAAKKGKIYLGLMASRLPGRFEIHTSILNDELDRLSQLVLVPPTFEELVWYDEYRKNIVSILPDYMAYNNLDKISIAKLFSFGKIKHVFRLLKARFSLDHYYDYQFGNPVRAITKGLRVNLKRKISAFRSYQYFESDTDFQSASNREQFYVYPIHFHPESSTSVLSPLYTNEYNNILNISNNLPIGVKLYVKEHISAYGCQSVEFYRKISSLPAVRLIKPSQNIKKIIIKSCGVITVNSTAGFEALILGKPVYLLGHVFYQGFPGVISLSNFSDLPQLIREDVPTTDVTNHVIAYYRFTYAGDLRITNWEGREPAYYDKLASLLVSKIK